MSEEAAPLREQIKSAFNTVGLNKINDDILSKCKCHCCSCLSFSLSFWESPISIIKTIVPTGVGLVSTSHATPQKLAEQWEVFSINNGNADELTEHLFQAYRNDVMKEAEKDGAVVSRPALGKRSPSNMVTPPNKRGAAGNLTPVSAVDKVATNRVSMSPNKVTPHGPTTPAVNIVAYGERTNAGQVLVTFNPNDLPASEATGEVSKTQRCVVSSSFPTNVEKPYRHMFTTLEERANALDFHLNKLGEAMVKRYDIGKDDGIAALEAIGVPRQDEVCCIGRICNEVRI